MVLKKRVGLIKNLEVWVSLISLISIGKVLSVSLDENGYYDVVVAVNEKTAQNGNEDYINNLKNGIQDLSDALFESTKRKFSIRSAEILLPNHWNLEADAFVTTQTYKTADIRISHEFFVPQAINPVFCGYPGHHIELPYDFFETPDVNEYGLTGKALLTLWAQFRWGVHEEHGFPGDSEFPYFWKSIKLPSDPPEESDRWRVTNCANSEVQGKFVDLEGKECVPDPDDPNQLYPPPSECRFHPSNDGQSVTTSLMSFQFIKSLKDFCDETNHDKRAPTRQNHFCQYKSVWEVIRETPDWKRLKENSRTNRTRVNFKIVKQASTKPLLFILVEGVNQLPDQVISSVSSGLQRMFDTNSTTFWNVLTSIGVFPGVDKKDSFDTAYPWNFPWFDPSNFISSFENALGTRSGFRDFGAALQDIGSRIRDMDHKEGAIILVVKYGSETDPASKNFFQAYESGVLGTLLEQKIRVFALEGGDDQGERLKTVTEFTGGTHVLIGRDEDEDKQNVGEVMLTIRDLIEAGSISEPRFRLAFKQIFEVERTFPDRGKMSFPVTYAHVKRSIFFLHDFGPFYINQPEFTKGPDSLQSLPFFQEDLNWGKRDDFATFRAESNEPIQTPSEWEVEADCQNFAQDFCSALLTVIVELDDDDTHYDRSKEPGNDISISLSTSQELDNFVDLKVESASSLKGSTFSIFARLEKNGIPIISPDLKVQASVIMYRQNENDVRFYGLDGIMVELLDDGRGSPDMTENDGIFSGSYIPKSDPDGDLGIYQVFVTAILKHDSKSSSKNLLLRGENASLVRTPVPVDQKSIRCGSGYSGCWSETVTEPFFVHADLKRRIEFSGSVEYKPTVFKVIDLKVEPLPLPSTNYYEISWTEPISKRATGNGNANAYELFLTEDFKNIFRESGEGLTSVPVGRPVQAGRKFSIKSYIDPGIKQYYVMRSVVGDQLKSAWSNIEFIEAANPYPVTTTTSTTSTTPKPTEPTTRLPTAKPTPSTAPTRPTTASPTTPSSTTTIRTTTRRRTTTPGTSSTAKGTSPRMPPSTERSSKRWYQTTESIVTFSVLAVACVGIIGGLIIYYALTNRNYNRF